MTGGRDQLTVSIAKVPAMFYLSRLPVMSHISCSPPTNALLLPLGTCTRRLRLVTARAGLPGELLDSPAQHESCGAAALRGRADTYQGELKPSIFLSQHLDPWPQGIWMRNWNENYKPRVFVPEGEALLREKHRGMPLPFWLHRQVLPGQIFNPFCFS